MCSDHTVRAPCILYGGYIGPTEHKPFCLGNHCHSRINDFLLGLLWLMNLHGLVWLIVQKVYMKFQLIGYIPGVPKKGALKHIG